jgi:hypothetical protein
MLRDGNPKFLRRSAAGLALAAACFVLAGCSEMLSREDFATRVKDKSDTEVATLVGKPATVDSTQPDRVTWIYNSRTFNIQEGNKFDAKTAVVFSKTTPEGKLKATDVVFE